MLNPSHTVSTFFPGEDREFWRSACAERDARPARPWNEEEIGALRDFNAQAGAPDAALGQIARLTDPRTLVVVAGQQAGLFLSPLYVLYKAVAAVKWAERLERLLERPVIGIFWIASEDHDLEEVRHVHYLDRDGGLARWTYGAGDESIDALQGRSVFDVPLRGDLLARFFEEIGKNVHPTAEKTARIERWRTMAEGSENFEDFFARGMARLLGPFGLVLVAPRLAPIRRRAVPVIGREIEKPGESTAWVQHAIEQSRARGAAPPLHRRGDEANFFLYRDDLRCKVTLGGAGEFLVHHPVSGEILERAATNELRGELASKPERFSPNVITRPVVQDAALPAIATLAGGVERQYLALLRDVYGFFGVPPSRVLMRPRVLLIEPPLERYMEKHGVPADLLAREAWDEVEERIVRSSGYGAALEALEEVLRNNEADFRRLGERLGRLAEAPAVASAIEKTASATRKAMERLEQRVRDEIGREQEAGGGHLRRLRAALHPDGKPQERVLGPCFPFLLNHGEGLVRWLLDSIDLDRDGVQPLFLSNIRE
jgi:bacillithiol biosynthesis cysteine-adding enzyme BshC